MGNTIASITIAYGPDELSTADAGGLGYPLNYADLSSNCTTATTDIGPGESPACYPWLEYMDKLMTLSPDWSNCGGSPTQPFLDNVYDPPRALVPTNALAGPATIKLFRCASRSSSIHYSAFIGPVDESSQHFEAVTSIESRSTILECGEWEWTSAEQTMVEQQCWVK